MDDSSPDQTPEVAQSFRDKRVRHIRNKENLGHLRNYNKGIRLAQGEYVWLISADDRLRCPYVLEQYVQIMDHHPEVGYAFCPAIALQDGQETGLMAFTSLGPQNILLRGHDFLRTLLRDDCVSAPSAMVRIECYEKVSLFPLDLPHTGDWYLWCIFALHYDVAYFAEPMVNRRLHDGNMSKFFEARPFRLYADEFAVLWRIKEKAEVEGYDAVVNECKDAIASRYARRIVPRRDSKLKVALTYEAFEESLRQYTQNSHEKAEIRARTYAELGDYYYWEDNFMTAYQYYGWAVQHDRWMWYTWAKYILLRTGSAGLFLRNVGVSLRDSFFALYRQLI